MRKGLRILALALFGAVIVGSLITDIGAHGSRNSLLLAGAHVPRPVLATIDRACRDCHSDATRYPWYSYVAPVSFLIDRDVKRGREHLNFSRWSEYSVIRRERCLSDIANQLQNGGMPLAIYTFIHGDAKLSKADTDALFEWTQVEKARLIMESAAANSR
jgi:hypothetical protein